MTFSRDSKVIKWAYFFAEDGPPDRTSLCALFWRTVLFVPVRMLGTLGLVLIVVSGATRGFWLLIQIAWQHPQATIVLVISGTVGGLLAWGVMELLRRRVQWQFRQLSQPPRAKQPSVIVEGFKAVKGKICPLVDIR